MKKILILSLNYYPKYIGGAEVSIKEIVERLPTDKYEFHMLTLRFDSDLLKEEVIHGIHVHRIGFTKKGANIGELKNTWLKYNKYYFQIFAFLHAFKLHREHKFDALWAMMAHSCAVPAGLFKTFFPKVKYLLTLQEGDPPEQIERMAKPLFWPISSISFWLFKNGFKKADVIQSLSTYLNTWAERMGNKNKKVVIPNAVNFKFFSQEVPPNEIQEVKNEIGIQEGDVWLITTSRMVYKNAIDDCINALAFLQDNVKFAIVGIGPEEDKLKSLVETNKLESRVKFLGEKKNNTLPKYLKACDIFVRPSRSEGFGISFVEAMAAKIPVIATTEGGIADFLFDEKTGYVCLKDDPRTIAHAVNRIMNDKELKNRVVENAYQMVQEKYDWDIVAKQMEKEFFEVI